MAFNIPMTTPVDRIIPLHWDPKFDQYLDRPTSISLSTDLHCPEKIELNPAQLKWALSVSPQFRQFPIYRNSSQKQYMPIDVPEWVDLFPSHAGALLATMAGAPTEMDYLLDLQPNDILNYHKWMGGTGYIATWATISKSKGYKLLTDLVNIYGLQHPATFELMVCVARANDINYDTLRSIFQRRGQDVVDTDDVIWDIARTILVEKGTIQWSDL